jgi:hypothetical protein
MYSLLQRLTSLRHGISYGVSERLRGSSGAIEETPARELCAVNHEQSERIAALRERYQVQFELQMNAATSADNNQYLDMLDRGWSASKVGPTAEFVVALLAWRLPLKLLAPARLFRQIQHNLNPNGLLVMVNHGLQEFALVDDLCGAAGLRGLAHWSEP